MVSYNDYQPDFRDDSGFQGEMAPEINFSLAGNLANEMLQSALLSSTLLPTTLWPNIENIQIAGMMADNIIETATEVANILGPEEAEAFLDQILASTKAGMSVEDLNNEINQFFSNLAN